MKKLFFGLLFLAGFFSSFYLLRADDVVKLGEGEGRTFVGDKTITGDLLVTGDSVEVRNASYKVFMSTVSGGTEYVTFTPSSATFRQAMVVATGASVPFQIFAANGVTNLFRVNDGGATTVGGSMTAAGFTTAGNVIVDPLSGVYVDGGGDTYIVQSSANVFDIVAGGITNFRINASSITSLGNTTLGDTITDDVQFVGLPSMPSNADPRANGIVPARAGAMVWNSTLLEPCISSGIVASSWTKFGAPTTACQ